MIDLFRRHKSRRQQQASPHREIIPEWMGYPGSDYSRYDPFGEERKSVDRKHKHALEGSGRKGWDYDQNRGYAMVYGNERGPSSFADEHGVRNFKGKGPRNYRRADERILEDIHHSLSEDWYVDASDIEVAVDKGEVVLSGTVTERSAKRRAEDLAESIRGVTHVENRIRIHRESENNKKA